MAEAMFLVKGDRAYKIIAFDQPTQMVTLEGPHGKFTETFDKERFKRMGYKLVKKEMDDAE